MAGIRNRNSYKLVDKFREKKEGVTEYGGKFLVRIPSSKKTHILTTIGRYDTIEEAEEVYRKSNELKLDKVNKNKK